MELVALLLAAGESKRMVNNKLLLPYRAKRTHQRIEQLPIIIHSLETLLQLPLTKIVVVVGHQATKLKKNIKLYLETKRREVPIEFALNKYYRSGMASSIRAGMKRVSLTTDAVLITLGDKPKIAVSTILSLIHRIPKTRKSIILPIYQGQTGHPVIFKKNYFSQLTSLNPSKLKQDYGARFLIEENQDDILKVKVNDAGVVRDIDTWQDYINTSIEN